jgi:hypothetical protein
MDRIDFTPVSITDVPTEHEQTVGVPLLLTGELGALAAAGRTRVLVGAGDDR